MTDIPSESMPTSEIEGTPQPDLIIAGPGSYYRNTRYVMLIVLVGMGLWFGYDGYVGWPKLNQQIKELEIKRDQNNLNVSVQKETIEELKKLGSPKTDMDILFQKILAFTLPPLGIAMLLRALHRSRGQYRLEGNVLTVPGHPPVPFENITQIDRHLWDKKGIAYLHYDLGNGQQGRLTLDDFIYDRPPTDQIFERIEKFVSPLSVTRESLEDETKKPTDESSVG